jgi:hypothetical protein
MKFKSKLLISLMAVISIIALVIPGCDIGTGAAGDNVYQGSNWTDGYVPIIDADGNLSGDSDLTFSGDTLTATKFAGDGSALTGLPTGCTTGATFPVSPSTGDLFLHVVASMKILYQYDGSAWKPICAYGDINFYVDKTDGTDDFTTNGFAVNSDAFASIQYALDCIPPVLYPNTARVFIDVNDETYTEDLFPTSYIRGIYNNKIYIRGTLTTVDSLVATGGTKGSGTTVNKVTGTFAAAVQDGGGSEYRNKLIEFTSGSNNGSIRVIGQVTADTIYLVGAALPAAPANEDTYEIKDWGTILDGKLTPYNCDLWLYYMKIGSSVGWHLGSIYSLWARVQTWGCYVFTDLQTACFTVDSCAVSAAWYSVMKIDITGASHYGSYTLYNSMNELRSCRIIGYAGDTGKGVYINTNSSLLLDGCEILDCAYGLYAESGSTIDVHADSVSNFIHGCDTQGVYALTGGTVVNTTNIVYGKLLDNSTADANTSGDEDAAAASFGYVD